MSLRLIKSVKLVGTLTVMHERAKRNDAVTVGNKYHFVQHPPVNNVDFLSEIVAAACVEPDMESC